MGQKLMQVFIPVLQKEVFGKLFPCYSKFLTFQVSRKAVSTY